MRQEFALGWQFFCVLLALAAFDTAYRGVRLLEGRQHISRGIVYIVVAVALLVLAAWFHEGRLARRRESTASLSPTDDSSSVPGARGQQNASAFARRWEPSWSALPWWGLLVAAIGLGFAFRLYLIGSQPFGVWFDEAQNGIVARQILHGYRPIFIGGATQLPGLFFYVFAVAIKLLGYNVQALRSVTTAAGILTLFFLYLLARELFGHRVAVLSTFFLAVMRWHVNFSRFAMHGIFAPLFLVATCYFLVRGLKGRAFWNFIAAGATLSIGLQGYYSFQLAPFLIGLYLLHHVIFERVLPWRRLALGVATFGFAAVIVYAPLGVWALQHQDQFNQRAQTVSITKGRSTSDALHVAYESMKTHLLMFNSTGDHNPRHNLPGEPMLDIYTGSLFLLGAGYALSRANKTPYFLLLAWVVVTLQAGIWSDGPPQAYRTVGVTPAIAMLAALPLELLWRLATERTHGRAPEAKTRANRFGSYALVSVAVVATLFSLGEAGYINFDTYFHKQLQRPDVWAEFSAAPTIIGQEVNRLRPEQDQFFVSTTFINEPSRIFLNGTRTDDIAPFDAGRQIPVSDLRPTVFFHDGLEESQFQRLRSLYPAGVFIERRAPGGGEPALFETILSQDDIRSLMGITALYTSSDGQRVERRETQIDADWSAGGPATLPFQASWSGFIMLPEYGEYLLGLQLPGHGRILLDGEPFAEGDSAPEARAVLFQGAHRIEIQADIRQAGPVQLYWQRPGEKPREAVPATNLFWSPSVYWGLRASFYSAVTFGNAPAWERLDPFVAFRYGGDPDLPVNAPFSVRWKGKLLVPLSGLYGLRLETIGDGTLLIDGAKIINTVGPSSRDERVPLTAGAHDIEVLFSNKIGNARIFLSWRPPFGEWANIPPQYFALK